MHECKKKNARVVCKVVFLLHDYRVNRTRTLRDISTSDCVGIFSLCRRRSRRDQRRGLGVRRSSAALLDDASALLDDLFPRKLTSG